METTINGGAQIIKSRFVRLHPASCKIKDYLDIMSFIERINQRETTPDMEGLESSVYGPPYRDCVINGIDGIWEEKDVTELLQSMGHDLLCHKPWYYPFTKCIKAFPAIRNQRSYTSESSK